jgi:2-oxoglutarate dehydrogenase E2 component (dihydrolipoamide succinyltransferase)
MSIVELKVPTIGESITEVTLSQWLKDNGEYVEMDEPICEFESDKATLEFPAEAAGKLIQVAEEGDDLEIGALVAKIDTSVSREEGGGTEGDGKATKDKEKEEKKTDKKEEQPAAAPSAKAEEESESYAAGHPSPAAAKILREHDIDPGEVKGTGKDGRITKEDAQQAVEAREEAQQRQEEEEKKQEAEEKEKPEAKEKEPASKPGVPPSPKEAFNRETERKKMSRMRRTIARRLVSAKNETAMLTTFNEIDLSEVIKLRKKYQDQFVEKYGIKLGFMSLFAKACAKALMEMPDVNAFIDGDEVVYHNYVDISIAISTPNGLVVPPVHNVESLHFAEIERKISELAEKARNGTLSLEEMSGGTFTITNGGIFGSLLSTPILNEPQSAILGMHAIQQRPVAVDGNVEIRPMMYVALSYDHRVIDGSTSVTFLVKVKKLLEDPTLLFLDL